MNAMSSGERYDFLDWLRVIAILVLLFFHTGMMFVGWGWHVMNADTISGLVIPMDISHRLRMPLLFVIAGAGMWFALQRRSGGQLFKERTVRLLIPLVVGMFLIVPPQIYYERLFHHQWEGGYLQFLMERVLQFQPYPQGDFSWHHLWFIAYLYVYVPLLLPLMLWLKRKSVTVQPGAWLLLLALPLGINEALLKPIFPESHTLLNDWYVFNHYLLFTAYGYVLAAMPGAWQWISSQRHRLIVSGALIYVTATIGFITGIIHRDTPVDAFVATIFTWLCVLGFIGYGYRHLSFENRLIRWARDASYPVYILHQTVIVVIGYYAIQQPWSPGLKYWAVLLATMASCIVLYQFVIRPFRATRLIFGMKPKSVTAPRATRGNERGEETSAVV